LVDRENLALKTAKKVDEILDDLTEEKVKIVSSAACGIFLWTRAIIDYIYERNNYEAPKKSSEKEERKSEEKTRHSYS